MKKVIGLALVAALGLAVAGCRNIESPILGTWATEDGEMELTLRPNGTFGMSVMGFDAATGRFSLSGSTITMTVREISGQTLSRMDEIVSSFYGMTLEIGAELGFRSDRSYSQRVIRRELLDALPSLDEILASFDIYDLRSAANETVGAILAMMSPTEIMFFLESVGGYIEAALDLDVLIALLEEMYILDYMGLGAILDSEAIDMIRGLHAELAGVVRSLNIQRTLDSVTLDNAEDVAMRLVNDVVNAADAIYSRIAAAVVDTVLGAVFSPFSSEFHLGDEYGFDTDLLTFTVSMFGMEEELTLVRVN